MAAKGEAAFSMGEGTKVVPMRLFSENRQRLVGKMKAAGHSGVIVLKGGEQETRHDTDHENIFRQESYFHWCFGVSEADCYGAIDIDSGKAVLFPPRLPQEYSVWMGKINGPSFYKEKYAVDDAGYADEIGKYLGDHHPGADVHVLYGRNSDSGNYAEPASFKGIESFNVKKDALFQIIANCRVFKSPLELEVLRYASEVTSAAHVKIMRSIQPSMYEYQLEALFKHHTYSHGGCRHEAYTCICATGPNGAVLHYGHAGAPNDRRLLDGDMALFDMGAEYYCFCSDITCSFPVNGKFTEDQKAVYQGVLDAVIAVETAIKPGTSWVDMHDIATRTILGALVKMGVLHGSIDDMMAVELGGYFMPSGLGHFIGLDTHDVGGYLEGFPERRKERGFKSLRTARKLEENMVLTVEPGMYFMEAQIDEMKKDEKLSKFINADRLEQFRSFGGVRIEDVVVVRKDGIENFTQTPRSIEEIESVMAGGAWPPAEDNLPALRRVFTEWPAASLK